MSTAQKSANSTPLPFNNQQSTINNHQSTIINRQSTIDNRQSTIDNRQSTIDNRQSTIVIPSLLPDHETLTLGQIVTLTNGKPSTVKLRMKELIEKGYLFPKGQGRGAHDVGISRM